jgi:hypothetical protein
MAHRDEYNHNAFLESCRQILQEHPEAIGVAFKWLDCGCSLLCGVSAKGDPVGPLVHVDGRSAKPGHRSAICFKCKKDSGLDRVVWQGIHWPGDPSEYPDRELRLRIGRRVFGPGYVE